MTAGVPTGSLLRDSLLTRVAGDAALASAMASLFIEECPRLLANVREALAAQDAAALARAAHALKGSVSNFEAPAATRIAGQLEMLGRDGDLQPAVSVVHELDAELARLLPALREVVA
jgi:HPt (histidine-containing phosphotransfer) domain-containing protein